jgi:hypothetical protein
MARIKLRELDDAMMTELGKVVAIWLDRHCIADCDFVVIVDPVRPIVAGGWHTANAISNVPDQDAAFLAAELAHSLIEKDRAARGQTPIAGAPRVFDA